MEKTLDDFRYDVIELCNVYFRKYGIPLAEIEEELSRILVEVEDEVELRKDEGLDE